MGVPMVPVRAGNGYDTDAVSLETGLNCTDESRTVQSQAEEADINTIVRRFGVTGQAPFRMMPPTLDEFVEVTDYRTALETVMRAREAFMTLDADVRKRFDNDPHGFVAFCEDPANLPELRKMGLAPEAPAGAAAPGKPA